MTNRNKRTKIGPILDAKKAKRGLKDTPMDKIKRCNPVIVKGWSFYTHPGFQKPAYEQMLVEAHYLEREHKRWRQRRMQRRQMKNK